MFLNSGEAKYVDVMELALYNSVLSGVSLERQRLFLYESAKRQQHEAPVKLRWSRTRVPFVTSFCCPPNVVRTVASVSNYAYGVSDNTIWVNLYGSNTFNSMLHSGSRVRIVQQSNYPWNGDIRIRLAECGSEPPTLKLRVPGWAKSATIKLEW